MSDSKFRGKYDDASWHYEGNFPEDLPIEAGGTHIGFFVAWAILNNLHGEDHEEAFGESLELVRKRQMTGREFLFKVCDGKFISDDLNDTGNRFAQTYYWTPEGNVPYLDDLVRILDHGLPTIYHIEDSWENYDLLEPAISDAFARWKLAEKD